MQHGSTTSPGEIVDTNVLVYAHDPTDPAKQAQAIALIHHLLVRDRLTVTAQVLNEFYARATRPNKPPALSHADALGRG